MSPSPRAAFALVTWLAACGREPSTVIAPVDAEVRAAPPAASDETSVAGEPPDDPTFPVVASIAGSSIDEATAYVRVRRSGASFEMIGLDVLADRIAGCDDRSRWATNHGAVLLARDRGAWTARFFPENDELPCPGTPDDSFDLAGGRASVRLDGEDAIVPGAFVDGFVEVATGKGASPAAKLVARFHARVCPPE